MKQILFLCTGNYYRSRFAEIVFNRLAEAAGIDWRADSRGLATELGKMLPGVISPHTIEALQFRSLTCDSITREPLQLKLEELDQFQVVIALKEAEHRPLLRSRYAGWEDKVVYWHVHDLDGAQPNVALTEIEQLVRELVQKLSLPAESEVYSLIGEAGFTRLVSAFYRQIPDDPVLGPMYPKDDLPGAEQRLRDFLIQRFGGPATYSQQRGHPRLRMRHAPFAIDQPARDRWMELMDRALKESELPMSVQQVLRPFLSDTASFMINR